ncbi:MAG: photosynthetic reaction center cytochrome PufC [Pseudomonadota bacterium]
MLPKWFNDWNKKNPTNVFGPGIVIGVVGGAVFVATMLVAWGQPFATTSTQTGPRGTGMSIPEFKSAMAMEDPTLDTFVSSAPIIPKPGDQTAGQAYPDAEPLLADLTKENYDRLVDAMRAWTGIEILFNGEESYQTAVARKMIVMTQNINEEWDGHVNANGQVGVTCATCHRGQPVPSETWFKNTPLLNTNMAGWSAVQNRATSTSNSTSLPSDGLEELLVNYGQISVHDLESRVAGSPADGARTIQDTERTYGLMNYFANSLGVNCNFCHNSRAFYDAEQVTPQWATASLGIAMVLELNNDYIAGVETDLPSERLGPIHQDVPKVACKTCHKGYQQPYQGLNVLADWPELASTGTPVYE